MIEQPRDPLLGLTTHELCDRIKTGGSEDSEKLIYAVRDRVEAGTLGELELAAADLFESIGVVACRDLRIVATADEESDVRAARSLFFDYFERELTPGQRMTLGDKGELATHASRTVCLLMKENRPEQEIIEALEAAVSGLCNSRLSEASVGLVARRLCDFALVQDSPDEFDTDVKRLGTTARINLFGLILNKYLKPESNRDHGVARDGIYVGCQAVLLLAEDPKVKAEYAQVIRSAIGNRLFTTAQEDELRALVHLYDVAQSTAPRAAGSPAEKANSTPAAQ